jgi:hypothetical protein
MSSAQQQIYAPVLDMARKFDIAKNPHPDAIFDCGSSGFQIWVTKDRHPDDPDGWNKVTDNLTTAAFSKPCAYLASVCWRWGEGRMYENVIVSLELSTTAYELNRQLPDEFQKSAIGNRWPDLEFAMERTRWLFKQAGVPVLPFYIDA